MSHVASMMDDERYAAIFQDIVARAAALGFGPASYVVAKATDVLHKAWREAEGQALTEFPSLSRKEPQK